MRADCSWNMLIRAFIGGKSWLVSDVLHLSDIYKAISKLIKPHFVGPINLPPPRDTLISRYSPIIGLIQLCTTCPANNLEQLMHRTRFHPWYIHISGVVCAANSKTVLCECYRPFFHSAQIVLSFLNCSRIFLPFPIFGHPSI